MLLAFTLCSSVAGNESQGRWLTWRHRIAAQRNSACVLSVSACDCRGVVCCLAGCGRISSGGWRQLAQACPHLEVIRLGGSAECSKAALKALPHILPGIPPPHKAAPGAAAAAAKQQAAPPDASSAPAAAAVAAAESWEGAFGSDAEEDVTTQPQQQDAPQPAGPDSISRRSSSSSCGGMQADGPAAASSSAASSSSGRLKHLQALIWPDVPTAAIDLVQQRCPRVLINPPLKPDKLTGELPPREWYAEEPLDEPLMQVGRGSWRSVTSLWIDEAFMLGGGWVGRMRCGGVWPVDGW